MPRPKCSDNSATSPARAQGRQRQNIERKAIQQIFTEFSGGSRDGKIEIGGCNDTDRHGYGFIAAETFKLAVLDHAQNLFLHRQTCIADLIQEQRAAVGHFKAAQTALAGTRESAGLDAEKFSLQKCFRKGRTIEFDDGTGPAAREKVHAGRRELFAGSALADDQHRPVQGRHPGKMIQMREKGRGLLT